MVSKTLRCSAWAKSHSQNPSETIPSPRVRDKSQSMSFTGLNAAFPQPDPCLSPQHELLPYSVANCPSATKSTAVS